MAVFRSGIRLGGASAVLHPKLSTHAVVDAVGDGRRARDDLVFHERPDPQRHLKQEEVSESKFVVFTSRSTPTHVAT